MGAFGNSREEQHKSTIEKVLEVIELPDDFWRRNPESQRRYVEKVVSRITGEKRLTRLLPIRNAIIGELKERESKCNHD